MANLLLTDQCVRSCPYCFAKKHMKDSPGGNVLEWEDFMYAVNFLQLGNNPSISLLGGEPTLHPEFVEYVLYLYERGAATSVFTSGVLSEKLLSKLVAAVEKMREPENRIFFICNVNHPSISPGPELERQYAFLGSLGKYTCLSYNIYQADFDLNFLAEYIERFGLKKHVRLGLAHPIYKAKNLFITADQMKTVGKRLVSFYPLFSDRSITMGMDCGFPLCMFDDDELGKMYKLSNQGMSFCCGAAIDIGTSLDVWPCFPLSGYEKRTLYDFSSFKELHDFEHEAVSKIRETRKGIFAACSDCVHFASERCAGGCAAHVLSFEQSAQQAG